MNLHGRFRALRAPGQGQGGQGLVEFVVSVAVLGPLLLGMLQAVLLYRAKSVLDYAAFMAARRGATNFAEPEAMCKGLAAGLAPLYAHQATNTGALEAYAAAYADACRAGAAAIRIVSPTRAAFEDWKEVQFDGVEAIPNDSLPFRGSAIKAASHLTVQDANVLKVEVTYRYPLIVPIIDRLIGTPDRARSLLEGHRVYSLPIVASALVRMQTPIRDERLLH